MAYMFNIEKIIEESGLPMELIKTIEKEVRQEFPKDEIFGVVIRGMITRLKQGEIPPRKLSKIATSPLGEGVRKVFTEIDKLRGYRPPKRQAEAASILRMLKKGYTPQQIIDTWQTMKSDKFYQDKELFLMSVEGQIGALTNSKTAKRIDPDKFIKGKYGHLVQR